MWFWMSACAPPPEPPPSVRAAGPLDRVAYAWQRGRSDAISGALRERGPSFGEIIALAGEGTWEGGDLQVLTFPPDRALGEPGMPPVGAALRIGSFSGEFDETSADVRDAAIGIRDAWRASGIEPAEFHVDYDAATGDLGGFARWLREIRAHLGGTPLTLTALPSWLESQDLPAVLAECDGWTLQVHGFTPGPRLDVLGPLLDPVRARADVERAAKFGKPLRVALPTYRYLAAGDAEGNFLGLISEDRSAIRPGMRFAEIGAEPRDVAGLVAAWTLDRPAEMVGIAWFRLPVPGDRQNLSWPALSAILQGREPIPEISLERTEPEPGLVEWTVANSGEGDAPWPIVPAPRGDDIGRDGMSGYIADDSGFRPGPGLVGTRLLAGESRKIGWIRLSQRTSTW